MMQPDRQPGGAVDSGLLVPLRPVGGGPPLYCVPPASGSPWAYQGLAACLPGGGPVYGLECPGLDGTRPPPTSVPELAEEYASLLWERDQDYPYHLAGWSMGTAAAFETALRLTARGRRVGALVLVDPPPTWPSAPPAEADILGLFLADLTGGAAETGAGGTVASAADVTSFFETARDQGLIPAELDSDFLHLRYTVFRANVVALVRYAPSGQYQGEMTLVRARQTSGTAAGWRDLAAKSTEHRLDGDHYSIMFGGALPALATIVAGCLGYAG